MLSGPSGTLVFVGSGSLVGSGSFVGSGSWVTGGSCFGGSAFGGSTSGLLHRRGHDDGRGGTTGFGVAFTTARRGAVVVVGAAVVVVGSSETVASVVGAGPRAGRTGAAGDRRGARRTTPWPRPAIAARLVTGATPVATTTPSAAVAATTNPSRECAGDGSPGRRRVPDSMSEVSGSGAVGPGAGWDITSA